MVDTTQDQVTKLREAQEAQEAQGQAEKAKATMPSQARLSDRELGIRIGQLKTKDREERLLTRQGENLPNSLAIMELKRAEAQGIVDSYIETEADAIIRSRGDVPRWRTPAHYHDSVTWLANSEAILDAVKAHPHPPTATEHQELSMKRKQTINILQAELTRREAARLEEQAKKEAERVAEIEAARKAALE